jgi:hypothetical protein
MAPKHLNLFAAAALLLLLLLLLPSGSSATAVEYCSKGASTTSVPVSSSVFAGLCVRALSDGDVRAVSLEKGWDYPVKVSSVEVVPDPVVRGQPATFKISASTGNQSVLRLRVRDSERICGIW